MKNVVRPLTHEAAEEMAYADPATMGDWEPPPPTLGGAMSSALLFLRRNLLGVALTSGLVGAATFGGSLLLFNKYSATAMLLVDPRATSLTASGGALSNTPLDASAIESLPAIAKSEGFLGALVDQLHLDHDSEFAGRGDTDALIRAATIEKLGTRLNVARRGTTYVLEVTANSTSSEKSARIANAAAQMIIDEQTGERSGASATAATSIAARLAELRARLSHSEKAAAELKAKLKVTDAGQGSTLLERRVYELNQQLVLAGAKTAEARARYDQLQKAEKSAGANLSPTIQSSVLNSLRADLARLTRQAADQATVLGGLHPEVASLRAQIADTRRQISAELARMVATARTEFLEAQQREAALASEMRTTQGDSATLGQQLVKLGELEREAKADRGLYEQLLGREKELSETKGLDPKDIRSVSPAVPPAKTKPTKPILAAVAAGVGLLAGLAQALAREQMKRTLRTTKQAEQTFGVEVAGLVPLAISEADATGFRQRRRPNLTPWLAEFCSSAALDGDRDGGRAILVTSSVRGEGRTTVARGVAACLAQGGARVLLIEADRAARSDTRPRFGLVDVLERGADLQRAFVEVPARGYTLLPFGGRSLDKNASTSALMSGVTLRATLRLCRRWFDIVVIDGPPALNSGHAKLLARQSDLAAFVIEWDKTSPASVKEALERLDAADATFILNKVDINRYRLFDPERSSRLAAKAEELSSAA